MSSDWTPERVERLKELCDAGWSASKMGAALGVSRNSALGKATRMGFKVNGGPGGGATHRTSKPHATQPPKLQIVKEKVEPVTFIGPIGDFPPAGTCRYTPDDTSKPDYQMCGHPVAKIGSSWCSAHAFICYDAPRTSASLKKSQDAETYAAKQDAIARRAGIG